MKFLIGLVTAMAIVVVLLARPAQPVQPSQQVPITTLNPQTQQQAQSVLDQAMQETHAKGGLAMVMSTKGGEIQALAATDPNMAARPWQPGSVVKPLLMAAALNERAITTDAHYYDSGSVTISGFTINNVLRGSGERSMQDVLNYSLNTGAIYILKQLGGGQINARARQTWYDYLTQHYLFNQPTHTGLVGERPGFVRQPTLSRGSTLAYASSSFGVDVTVSPIQLSADYAALVNGGTYYSPRINSSQPVYQKSAVISTETSAVITKMLEQVAVFKDVKPRSNFMIGAKSGTAPLADDQSNYKPEFDSGTFVGFIGKGHPEQIIMVRLDEPQTSATEVASTLTGVYWTKLANQMMDTINATD